MHLKEIIEIIKKVVPKGNSLPVLKKIKIKNATVSYTNLDVFVKTETNFQFQGEFLLDFQKLNKILRKKSKIREEEHYLDIDGFAIEKEDVTEYPTFPEVEKEQINDLLELRVDRKLLHYCGRPDGIRNLDCIFLDKTEAFATNGHILHAIKYPENQTISQRYAIPQDAYKILTAIADKWETYFNDKHVFFQKGNWLVISPTRDFNLSTLDSIFPEKVKQIGIIKEKELLEFLKQIKEHTIVRRINGKTIFENTTPSEFRFKQEFNLFQGHEIHFCINAQYLYRFLNDMPDDCHYINFSLDPNENIDKLAPLSYDTGKERAMVMPVRLHEKENN
jgi:DNA polymerase III sliding clamp (beta) subunit (PCNA family)